MPVQAALQYMEEHLDEPLDFPSLAKALHYSKYHLLHQFTAAAGQPPHAYFRRRRLTEAARLLAETDQPIMQAALCAGYESQQAFSTRFKAMYKCTPAQFRARRCFYALQLPMRLDAEPVPLTSPDFAVPADIPQWMALVRLTVDSFPCLEECGYLRKLAGQIAARRALIVRGRQAALGAAVFSADTGAMEFFAVHPQYWKHGIEAQLLARAAQLCGRPVSVTTFRARDCADPGYRAALLRLGFAEGELLTEFGYPTQRMVQAVRL